MWYEAKEGFEAINALGASKTPFLFVIGYDKSKIFCTPLKSLDEGIYYKIEDVRNFAPQKRNIPYTFSKSPIGFDLYQKALNAVQEEIRCGNTYLLNLTFKTPIQTNLTLKEIFIFAKAKFKLYFQDKFICFSPERFVKIENNTISTYPMKGTIDAAIPNAKELILADEKEMAEHIMIVDLMRNDLGTIASSVKVERFRYIDKIKAGSKALLQVSSHIKATLDPNWHRHIGTLLDRITPAGSITGTPKKKTVEIIERIEDYDRGFYTGVFGIFTGASLNSAVMIRFIERENGKLFYKSGGGITIDSVAKDEYEELIDKIYLPF